MSDLMLAIKTILSGAWKFFTSTTVPGTDFSFAVLAVGLLIASVSLTFLSLVLGFPIGSAEHAANNMPTIGYGSSGSSRYRLPPARQNDTH